ncbi:MAG: hypothetical protein ABIS07_10275 [Dokdonella sp.]
MRNHAVVDVASDGDLADLVERDRRRAASRSDHEFETLCRRERIDVMARAIAVMENHLIAGTKNFDVRNKRLTALIDDFGYRRWHSAERLVVLTPQAHDRIRDGRRVTVRDKHG